MEVYKAISNVMAAMAKEGIEKSRRNQQQGYAFRGIDDVMNSLSPILAENKLCVLPRVMSREVTERQTRNGGALFITTMVVEFDFISAEDGSKHTVCTIGEAADSGDKSSNKAMSAALKYACLQTFMIPTEGDNDADATTHEVAPKRQPERQLNEANKEHPSYAEMKRKLEELTGDLLDCNTPEDINKCSAIWGGIVKYENWPKDYRDAARRKFDDRRQELPNRNDDVRFPGDE